MARTSQRILIICEGETEYFYSKDLKSTLPRELQRVISVEIEFDNDSNPNKLLAKAIVKKKKAKKEGNPYTDIWLFFDNDNCGSLDRVFEMSARENFKIAYSSMCIEHWFLLHFENCGQAFLNGNQAKERLKKHWQNYHKTNIRHFTFLKEKLNLAIDRAEMLSKNSNNNGLQIYQQNPYFTIQDLIAAFQNQQ